MKKKLLALAVLCMAAVSANAQEVVTTIDYSSWASYPYGVDGFTTEMVDNTLRIQGTAGWYQFSLAEGVTLESNTQYTVTIGAIGSSKGAGHIVIGNWGIDWVDGTNDIQFTKEWAKTSTTFTTGELGESTVMIRVQPRGFPSVMGFAWLVVSKGDAEPETTPALPTGSLYPDSSQGNVLKTWYVKNAEGQYNTFGGWGATSIENIEEDGTPWLKVVNDTERQYTYSTQISIPYDFQYDQTYYLSFDIKGEPAMENIEAGFQANQNYIGRGYMDKFDISPELKHVIIAGTVTHGADEEDWESNPADKILLSVGKYVGTFYMTNVQLYTKKNVNTGVAISKAEVENHWTVYTMTGAKVMDTANKADLNNLRPGLYIVNGKKIVIR